jgi:3-phenylpropionate/trans-cinnamate dioxygenase ferredoxin subunit
MTLVRIGAISEVPEGQARIYEVEGRSLCVANVGGQVLAIDNVCTHDGGPLGDGTLWDGQVECPRHGARFDLRSGRPVTLPAVMPVKTYAVQVDGDDVKVDL